MISDESIDLEKKQALLHCSRQAMLYPIEMDMKDRLRKARQNVGFSKTRAARKIGISPQALGQWEKGETSPNTDHLFAAAAVYRIPAGSLESGPHPLPDPAPDRLEEFKQKLLEVAEMLPEAQRGPAIGILQALLPKPSPDKKTRQRAS